MNESPHTPGPPRYMPQLDGLRAIAVFAVVWSHWMWDHTAGLPWGHFGVQLFFVLSGYLITGILLRVKPEPGQSRGPALKQFFIRRALRIFPAYYLVLAIAWMTNFAGTRTAILWHASYATNVYLWLTKAFSPTSHFWSLAVEEQFYLIWPWVVLWVPRRVLLRVAIAMIIATPVFQIVMQWVGPMIRPLVLSWLDLPNLPTSLAWLSPETEPTVLMPSAADALGVGALLALAETCEEWKTTLFRVQLLVCLPIFLILQGDAFLQGYGQARSAESIRETVMVVSFSLLVSQAATGYRGPVGWVLSSRTLTGVGKISYGIYLIHNFTPHLVSWFLEWQLRHQWTDFGVADFYQLGPVWRFLVFWFTTLGLAGLSYIILERPCLKLKDRLSGQR